MQYAKYFEDKRDSSSLIYPYPTRDFYKNDYFGQNFA